jgi:2-hydroxycyclohexanecarboxyl-CoA dehydrogenase
MDMRGPKSGVVVIGGGAGVGRAASLALAEQGRPVSVWDAHGEAARAVAKECRERFGVVSNAQVFDLKNEAAMALAIPSARRALGSIGALAYCAGANAWTGGPDEASAPGGGCAPAVYLRSSTQLIRWLLPCLQEAGPGSAVVMLSSANLIDAGASRDPAYMSTKAGLIGLNHAMSRALARDDIRINVICRVTGEAASFRERLAKLGYSIEDIGRQVPLGRASEVDDVARAIGYLLSDEASSITGINFVVDGASR